MCELAYTCMCMLILLYEHIRKQLLTVYSLLSQRFLAIQLILNIKNYEIQSKIYEKVK